MTSTTGRTAAGSPSIRDATPGDFAAVCALNLDEVRHTSDMDAPRLRTLHALSCYHKVAVLEGVVSAFLLAMRHDAPYANDNFEWFARRYARFVYVDRIVVSASAQGRRLGSLLYEDLFRYVRAGAIPRVACEYNIVPPNEPSRAFHDRFGFKEQGRQWLANGAKQVSLQVVEI